MAGPLGSRPGFPAAQPLPRLVAPNTAHLERALSLVVAFYLGLHSCYAPEFLSTYLNFKVPVAALTGMLVFLLWLVSGRIFRFMETSIAITYMALLVWWLMAAAFLSFRGYFSELMEYGVRFHLFPLAICGIAITTGLVRTLILGYGSGFIVSLFLCWKYGVVDSAGRFAIPSTSLGNPNDLALHLLLGASFLTILLFDRRITLRVLWFVLILVSMLYVLKTGSRANFITLIVLFGAIFLVSSALGRAMLLLGGLAVGVTMLVLIPRSTWVRLTTFENISAEDLQEGREEVLLGAVGSTEARKQLQMHAIKLTLQHPIFGVGPRMFVYALDDMMRNQEQHNRSAWQVPHNTYLDVSSETGVPGLLLYVAVIIWCIVTNYRAFSKVRSQPAIGAAPQSVCLMLASIAFAVGTLFCSIPYDYQLPFLVGLTGANWLGIRDEMAMQAAAAGKK